MSFSEKDIEIFQKNELKPEDTFNFKCDMCGDCCRNRSEPILLTGADIFRIAHALGKTIIDVLENNATGYIGDTSHIPVVVLKERADGSCSFLREGRCMVHRNKPAVCALYPLGRFYNLQDNSFHYFLPPKTCQSNCKSRKSWTLQKWLDNFKIRETEEMTQAWNRLMGGITKVTHNMQKDEIKGTFLEVLLFTLYLGYNTNRPYIEQVEQHMSILPKIFKREFHKIIEFEHG